MTYDNTKIHEEAGIHRRDSPENTFLEKPWRGGSNPLS